MRRCLVLQASYGLPGARKQRTCQLPARMRVPSPAILSLRSLYAAYGLVSLTVGAHNPKIVENGGGCVPEGSQHSNARSGKPGRFGRNGGPKRLLHLARHCCGTLGSGLGAQQAGGVVPGGAPTRQHGAPCMVVGGWLPASRSVKHALIPVTRAYNSSGTARRVGRLLHWPAATSRSDMRPGGEWETRGRWLHRAASQLQHRPHVARLPAD